MSEPWEELGRNLEAYEEPAKQAGDVEQAFERGRDALALIERLDALAAGLNTLERDAQSRRGFR